MRGRPNLLVAATIGDAVEFKSQFRDYSSWFVMTPRSRSEQGWLIGDYLWTPQAKDLPATVRWDLKQRLYHVIDDESEEKHFLSSA